MIIDEETWLIFSHSDQSDSTAISSKKTDGKPDVTLKSYHLHSLLLTLNLSGSGQGRPKRGMSRVFEFCTYSKKSRHINEFCYKIHGRPKQKSRVYFAPSQAADEKVGPSLVKQSVSTPPTRTYNIAKLVEGNIAKLAEVERLKANMASTIFAKSCENFAYLSSHESADSSRIHGTSDLMIPSGF